MDNMIRRSFLMGIGAALAAPTIVHAGNLMPIRAIERVLMPVLWGDGIHDDTAAFQALLNGDPVKILNECASREGRSVFVDGRFAFTPTVESESFAASYGASGFNVVTFRDCSFDCGTLTVT